MRMQPSKTIDIIYIDPPFFSGRNYNIIFGDQNEIRSFTDIWEGGMPGYLTWLNARLLEMKRLLKPTGSIFIHCDWHASHYIKIEMDKIFGYDSFVNEIIWRYRRWPSKQKAFQRMHDTILWYRKNNIKELLVWNQQYEELLSKLEEDNTIEVIGFDSRNAMGIDKLSGLDRYDIRHKKIFEEACSGTFTGKVGAKNFSNPLGKVKFCIRVNGLITIFRKNLTVPEISLIVKDLLKFLQNPTTFPPTLSSFV